jgi:hypothetical protein
MANSAPGVNINVAASASNPNGAAPTGTWFVLGTAQGPAGVAVPINSMSDFIKYFGSIPGAGTSSTVNNVVGRYVTSSTPAIDSTLLYDSLDVFFREGGIQAYVSRVQPTSTGVAATSATTGGKILLTALGKGTWANSGSGTGAAGLIMTINAYTYNTVTYYGASIAYNGNTLASASGFIGDTDIINWVNSNAAYNSMCVASAQAGTSVLPVSGSLVNVTLTGGTDVATADGDSTAALAVFNDSFGVGQVSFPGNTSSTIYQNLTNHAATFNRIAVLDGANTATAATLTGAVATLQTSVNDASYASMFAPWIIVPGTVNSNPIQPGIALNRVVPPSSLAASNMAANDQSNDCNNPAAGITGGNSVYAIGLSQTYNATDRATLNNGGVNVIRNVPGVNTIAIYGFRTTAIDPNWVYLNNTRFRMQVIRDFDLIGESFMFREIDGKGQVFSTFNGALAGQCQAYWTRKSIYGATPDAAFSVNTGPQVNNPVTIAAGQINAAVNLKMSPFGEFVTVNVTKYLVNAPLPSYTNA